MKINIKKREHLLLIMTIAVGLIAILYHMGFASLLNALSESGEILDQEKERFQEYVTQLNNKDEIEKAYNSIQFEFPQTDPDKKPEQQFSEDVVKMCAKYGLPTPNIGPPKDEIIENVDDYKFISLTIRINGSIEKLSSILKEFNRNALLIEDITLTATLDEEDINAGITLARIAKLTPEESARLQKARSSSRSSTPSTVRRRFSF